MPVFKGEEPSELRSYVIKYNNWVANNIDKPVSTALGLRPQELEDTFAKLTRLIERLSHSPSEDIETELLPSLKAAIIYARRTKAFDREKRSGFTFNHELRTRLEERLSLFSAVMSQDWFKDTEICGSPRITDFLSIQHAERLLKQNRSLFLSERTYDEKFHILNAPSLFLPDLSYYRAVCELRGVPLCVAYMDIDKFKNFNTKYGEPRVDRDVLPRFMSALEAQIYSHGHAYRYGGDEYVITLPNMSCSQAISFLKLFQKTLRELEYFGIGERPEVSIGIFEVSENSIQTDREIEERAASAKNFAKSNGRNCIAAYRGQSFADEDLYVDAEIPDDS